MMDLQYILKIFKAYCTTCTILISFPQTCLDLLRFLMISVGNSMILPGWEPLGQTVPLSSCRLPIFMESLKTIHSSPSCATSPARRQGFYRLLVQNVQMTLVKVRAFMRFQDLSCLLRFLWGKYFLAPQCPAVPCGPHHSSCSPHWQNLWMATPPHCCPNTNTSRRTNHAKCHVCFCQENGKGKRWTKYEKVMLLKCIYNEIQCELSSEQVAEKINCMSLSFRKFSQNGARWALASVQHTNVGLEACHHGCLQQGILSTQNVQRFQLDAQCWRICADRFHKSCDKIYLDLQATVSQATRNFFGHQSQRHWMHWKASLLLHASRWPNVFNESA